jgi:ubiquinone/menaquinone biosynthesis C-methylase UbiE
LRSKTKQKSIRQKVVDHFKDTDIYRVRKGIVHEEDLFLIDFIGNHASGEDKILEVGGGSGAFLDLVIENTNVKEAYNVELVAQIYKNQVNEKICLIGGDALNLPFKDCTFEIVVVKNLFHHLVGRTRKQSKENVLQTIKELIRVAKKGGYVIILELFNRYNFFSSIIFYLTLFFSCFGLHFEMIGLRKNVIVSFLTPNEIMKFLREFRKVEIILKYEIG